MQVLGAVTLLEVENQSITYSLPSRYVVPPYLRFPCILSAAFQRKPS